MKALLYNMDEYNNLLYSASNNNVEICTDIDGWFYVSPEDYNEDVTDEIVYTWLSTKLNATVIDVVIDACKDKVAIICK